MAGPLAVRQLDTVGDHPLAQIIEKQLWKSSELAQVANIMFPVTALDQLPPMHKPSISLIWVNQDSNEVYRVSGKLALSKATILKMLNAAGASYKTEKLTPNSDLNYIRWGAMVWGNLPDGTYHQATASKAWSWEKCQEEMEAKQSREYRKFADEQTETKALLRAARAFLNIQTAYTAEELKKPFMIARSVPDLDMSDPEIKRMVAKRLVESSFALYGGSPQQPTAPALSAGDYGPDVEDDDEHYDPDEHCGEVIDHQPEVTQAQEAAPAAPDYDPFAQPATNPEEDVNASLREMGQFHGPRIFGELMKRHNITNLAAASFDQKMLLLEDAKAVKEGRLTV